MEVRLGRQVQVVVVLVSLPEWMDWVVAVVAGWQSSFQVGTRPPDVFGAETL